MNSSSNTIAAFTKYRSIWIDVARVLACYLIVCVHIPGYPVWSYEWSMGGRNALFFMLAGYFCRFNLPYRKMFHKVLWLLIPLFLWNVIAVCSGVGAFNEISFKSLTGLGGFSVYPSDGPLWFLFYIVLFTLFVPCLRLTVNYKWIVILILLIVNSSGEQIFEKQSVLFFVRGLFPFYLGLCLGDYKLKELEEKILLHRRYIVIIFLSLIICMVPSLAKGYLQTLLGIFTIISLSVLLDRRCKRVSRFLAERIAPASFLIFAGHIFIINYLFYHSGMEIGIPLKIVLPFIIVTVIAIIYNFFNAVFPPVLILLAHKIPGLKDRGQLPTRKWDLVFVGVFACLFFPVMYFSSYACFDFTYVKEKSQENTIYIDRYMWNGMTVSDGKMEREFLIKPFDGDTVVKFSFIAAGDVAVCMNYKNNDENYDTFKEASFVYSSAFGARTFSITFPKQDVDWFVIRLTMTLSKKCENISFLDTCRDMKKQAYILKICDFVEKFPEQKFRDIAVNKQEMANLQIIGTNKGSFSIKSLTNDPIINLEHPIRTNSFGITKLAIDYTSSQRTQTEFFFAEKKIFNGEQMMRFSCKEGRNKVILAIVGKPNTEYDLRFDPSTDPGVTTTIHSISELTDVAETSDQE